MSDLRVAYLADHPGLTTALAEWFYAEWGKRQANQSVEKFAERLRQRLNRDRPPLTLIAFMENELVASTSLKIREMETHPHHEHWLGSVYVKEMFRGQGIGTEIIKRAAQIANEIGIVDLYLYTHSHEAFYQRMGWRSIERPMYHGREVAIMMKEINTLRSREVSTKLNLGDLNL